MNAAMRDMSGQGVLFSHAVAARLGVHSTDLECLGYLIDGPRTAGALADATGLTSGAITGVIDRLERAGFATREADPADRRRVLVRATDAVAERAGAFFAPMERATTSSLAVYTDDELAFLLEFLIRTRDAAQAVLATLRETPPAGKGRRRAGPA
jgi:DNA-binding MarR family transcriptional regulator